MRKGIKPLICINCGAAYRTWWGYIRHKDHRCKALKWKSSEDNYGK